MTTETWTPVFIMSSKGTSVVELEAMVVRPSWLPQGEYRVRRPGLTKQKQPYVASRWNAHAYDQQFGATRQEAIEKGVRFAEHRVAWFEEQLAAAQARLALVRLLAAVEPQEQP